MKKLFTLLLLSLMATAHAKDSHDFVVDNKAYKIISGTTNCEFWALKTDSKSVYSGDFVIPSSVSYGGTTYTVTGIGDEAFEESTITSISIPETVTTIGKEAFEDCENLTTITIGKNITFIGDEYKAGGTFYKCTSLTSINVEAGNANFSSIDGVLFSKDGKTIYAYPAGKTGTEYTVPDGVETIAYNTFLYQQHLTNVIIGNNVKTIADSHGIGTLFRYLPNLQKATIGGVTSWSTGSGIVMKCPKFETLTLGTMVPADVIVSVLGMNYDRESNHFFDIVISDDNQYVTKKDGFLYDKAMTKLLGVLDATVTSYTSPAGVTAIADSVFSRCEALTSLTINDDVTSIEYSSLFAPNLETLIIGNGITALPEYGLNINPSLKKLVLGNGITAIPENSFCGTELQELTIGSHVASIGSHSFMGNSQLKDITVLATTPPTVGEMVFGEDFSQYTLHVQAGCKAVYQADAFWGKFTKIVEDAATGISASHITVIKPVARYTLNGIHTNSQRGINIVKMSDGTTRKVIVK